MSSKTKRIEHRFQELKDAERAGRIAFVTAGDPDLQTSIKIMKGLPRAGADIIELGMPFTDPMADGSSIQVSSQRALRAGQNMCQTLEMVNEFRNNDDDTPVVLMGYYNPIYVYGIDAFVNDAADVGVDGLIIVDLPPEEDSELREPAAAVGIDFIRLATPTSDEGRLPSLLETASGFVYYVSITGITGTRSAETGSVSESVSRIKKFTALPVAVGFGIKTPEQAAEMAGLADAVVVGSAIVQRIEDTVSPESASLSQAVDSVLEFVHALATGVQEARLVSAKEVTPS